MKGYPYIPWYHGDFLRSTVGWTLLEQAVYWKLLCAQWEIGTLPPQVSRLATIAGIELDEFMQIWDVVGKKFVQMDDGFLNTRMEVHRSRYVRYRVSQSEKGKAGMESRWGKKKRPKSDAEGSQDE